MGVDFGGEDGFVAQHLLHDAEVCAVFNQMGGKRVAEGVGRDLLMDSGHHGLVLHQFEDRYPAERFPELVQEQDVLEAMFDVILLAHQFQTGGISKKF